jgi:hypothetical protein
MHTESQRSISPTDQEARCLEEAAAMAIARSFVLRPQETQLRQLPCILSAAKYLTDSQEARCLEEAAAISIARSLYIIYRKG